MQKEIDVAAVYAGQSVSNFGSVSGKDLLGFAKLILFYLFLLVIFVFASSYMLASWGEGNEFLTDIVGLILNITQTAVPSIVSLVLGFYFGRRSGAD